jgi:hypothetical protein
MERTPTFAPDDFVFSSGSRMTGAAPVDSLAFDRHG